MSNRIVWFDIENNQEEYVQCLHIVEGIENKSLDEDDPFLQSKVKFISSERKLSPMDILEQRFRFFTCDLSEIIEGDRITYFFLVKCADENDIINLIYYCLIYDRIEQSGYKCMLCVECGQKQGANIRDLLTWLLHTGTIKNCFTYIDGVCRLIRTDRIQGLRHASRNNALGRRRDGVRIMKQFSPIFRIDEKVDEGKYESVMYWRLPMRTFLQNLYKQMNISQEKMPVREGYGQNMTYGSNYFLPHVCPNNLCAKYPGEVWQGISSASEKHLLSNFIECFCTIKKDQTEIINSDFTKFSEKRYEMWKSQKLFELIKEMPLLAMYIFCISDYFMRDVEKDSWERIEQEIFDARDMADGLLQILENIYHSEGKRGYFCFRVHADNEDRSGQYLKKEYKSYMEEWCEKDNPPRDYLEIKVVDFSHCSIPRQFCANFKKRMDEAQDNDKSIYENLVSQASELKVSSFFKDDLEFWTEYNKISENVIHHYGLQIFESLISCYDGYFGVRSQETELLKRDREFYSTHKMSDISDKAIPGTQYDILIPFRKPVRMQNLSLDVNINYTDGLLKGYNDHVCRDIELMQETCKNILKEVREQYPKASYQERKEKTIQALADCLRYLIESEQADSRIIHFSAEKIPMSRIELFCKAVMLNIVMKPVEQSFNVMITDCTSSHFVEITRMMALFYNKQGENPLMRNAQIFMSGKKEGEEFLITGSNLREAIGSTEKLAFARCTHPDCLKILKKMLKNHKMGVMPNDIVSIVPFDMIQYDLNKPTLLERRLEDVLNQNVQSEQFGCKLDGLHVRIGSKIHIRTFYEAELLFHNNYYTSRFAYWLYNELRSNGELDLQKPFVLVGCENYSEMLLNEVCNMFEKVGIETEYLIYEERIAGKFRGKKALDLYKDYQFVITVPINSTLTTHIKISGFLEKSIRGILKKSNNKTYEQYSLGKVLNYGIVLICTEGENDYWYRVNGKKNTILSKINGNIMKYYVEVMSEWANPLACKACFPDNDYTKEIPMVETNKESVVPMHAIGIRKREIVKIDKTGDEGGRIQDLSKFLVYKHVERNGNHFNYYFATEKLWDFPEIRNKVRYWLKQKEVELFKTDQYKVYDIIVAPLHYSNTVFVEEVNGCLFKNAALVLHFDADKEFRMNVKTKYSSIQQLYDNLCEDNEKSTINFHYVDDTIVSGRTFRRMKSLIRSMIRVKENQNVQINIFKSIVLLLNRMSRSSIGDYIEDQNYFLAYFNLKISSMRVNSDACVLCKKYAEWNKLAQQASLNKVFGYWQKKSEDLKCVPVEKIDVKKEEEGSRKKRNEQYMIASHRAKGLLDVICDYKSISDIQQMIVERLFPDDISDSLDELIAMLKILGRPFLSFRREEKEAIFGLMLMMLDALLAEKKPQGEEKLYMLLRQIWENDAYRVKIVKMLMNRLAELESNFIIRKRSMNQILEFCTNHIANERKQQEFVDNYLNRVKQLVGQSNDFAKGLYLEYLLLYDEEYQEDITERKIVSLTKKDCNTAFKKNVYLENTKLINYGIEYLAESFSDNRELTEDSLKRALNDNYYFDNFIQYLVFHKVIEVDEKGKVLKFTSKEEQRKIEGMVRFELLYRRIFEGFGTTNHIEASLEQREAETEEELKDKFMEMMECLRDAGGALDGEIIVPYGKVREGMKYIALELGTSIELRRLENNEQNLREFMAQNTVFEGDTYAICDRQDAEHKAQKWILLKFFDNVGSGSDDISVIYLLFPFKTQDEDEILHSLKNILIFRHKIWEILNLSSSTLLQNWTDNLFYKQQMLKSRAVGHSELDTLMEQFKDLSRQICEEYQNKSEQDKKLCRDYFELLVNSMIGAMNAQVLGNRGTDNRESIKHSFIDFWKTMHDMNNAVSIIWNLEICIVEKELEGYQIRHGTEQKDNQCISPGFEVLQILLLAVFHNIWKHGRQEENQNRKVDIHVKENKLCISNCVDEENKIKIERAIMPDAYRSGQGISQAVIYDICNSWYRNTKYTDVFDVCKKSNGNEWVYVVKLPIIERWEDNDTI